MYRYCVATVWTLYQVTKTTTAQSWLYAGEILTFAQNRPMLGQRTGLKGRWQDTGGSFVTTRCCFIAWTASATLAQH